MPTRMPTTKNTPFNLNTLESGLYQPLLPPPPYTPTPNSTILFDHEISYMSTPTQPSTGSIVPEIVPERQDMQLAHPSPDPPPLTGNPGTTPDLHGGVERETGNADRQSLFFRSGAGTELYLPGLRLPTIPAIEPVTCQIITILFTLCLVASVSLWVYTTLKSSSPGLMPGDSI
ncbi:hypothetical protein BC835DRAFT_1305150 [Cytidiella melzeri]|nr:hypothetical protein BC835DRAFT_1305150 [Cytidiella melzeri]